ncbi:hypothetical protein [Pseudomonas syringae]|uniref:Uncharacterized protein n=1 Tax=Pseudomonas syringae TaxID=317 RepID=A0A085V002_PSESX|nr:hypothetical protein [Pseudomonas syringae]KFE48765.1 hypothetical protein IV02_21215 [Pseudomonas syringae]
MSFSVFAGTDPALVTDGIAATSNAGHNINDTFNLKGTIPAKFGLYIRAIYSINEIGSNCRIAVEKTSHEAYTREYTVDIAAFEQHMNFAVPLEHTQNECNLHLWNLDITIIARHNAVKEVATSENFGAYVLERLRDFQITTNSSGELHLFRKCSWRFTTGGPEGDSINRIFYCSGEHGSLPRKQLKNNVVNFVLKDLGEEPGYYGAWVKFPNGWKPCALGPDASVCTQPREFKAFKIDGQLCTIYPNCTER